MGVWLLHEWLPPTNAFLPDIPVVGTSLLEPPFADFLAIPSMGKWDYSPSNSLNCLHSKKTCISSPELRLEVSTAPHGAVTICPDLTPETGTWSRWQGHESSSPPSCHTRGLADPDDEVATGSSKSTEEWTSSDSGLSKGNMADSNIDTASWNCLSCSDTDDRLLKWNAEKE